MVQTTKAAASIIGVVAGLVGAYHGYNEVLQGSTQTGGVLINAIGPPCQGSSCFPAMTLIPNFEVTGYVAILVSIVVLVWAAAFVQKRRGGVTLVVLSVVLLLVGGGYLPPALGIIAGLIGARIRPKAG